MKLAMAQMSMSGSMDENLKKSLAFCDAAAGSDLLFFPEVQLTPFFPQYAGRNVDAYAVPAGSPTVQAFADKAKERGLYLSPNMYLEQEGKRYDASLWLTPEGACAGVAKMVHIMQAAQFYERDEERTHGALRVGDPRAGDAEPDLRRHVQPRGARGRDGLRR